MGHDEGQGHDGIELWGTMKVKDINILQTLNQVNTCILNKS